MSDSQSFPLPDFDEWYVVDRHPAAIQLAKEKWRELEQFKMEVNHIQGLVKNNRHSLATSNDVRRLQRKCEEQAALHEDLTEMQRELALKKIAFRACGVIKLTHMERAFLEEAEKYLAAEAFHAIKQRAVTRIRRELARQDVVRKPNMTRLGDLPELALLVNGN
jgi:hypothetical protein